MNDGFGLAGEMRRLGEKRAGPKGEGGGSRRAKKLGLRDERGEAEGADAHADAGEELAAREEVVLEVGRDAVTGMNEMGSVVGDLAGVG